ncbi:membrane protein [Shewanella colwelliana]|uniref:Membrane protein n=1 Tax=Shewanella colwelliana TaxID=23 RepID=A0ABQ4P1H4_SHECO|nr:membrane protein [Shewanella colwelliana]GIU41355.1 membrane protein [Shewanella colwelliana]
MSEPTSTTPEETREQQTSVVAAKLPKRLILLLLFLAIASISGIVAKQGVLFCILTLFMVIAVLGRQKAGLYMLRGYTIIQLGLVSLLPVILYDPDNLVAGPSTFRLGDWEGKLPDYLVFGLLIALSVVQVWVAFNAKVKAYCHVKTNMNIMR